VYVLAASMLDDADLEPVREEVSNLATTSGLRFHWRKESYKRRYDAVNVVGCLPMLHMVVVGAPLDPARQERARRLCLRRMLFELEAQGVTQVWMEARTRSLNSKDVSAVDVWRSQHVISHKIRIDHADPATEPLLWVPDIVAGTANASEAGNHSWSDEIKSLTTIMWIELD
jgi:hypothetical protein